MVFEGGPHSFGLLRWGVGLLVPVQVVGVVLVTAWEGRERERNGQLTVQKRTTENMIFMAQNLTGTCFLSARNQRGDDKAD